MRVHCDSDELMLKGSHEDLAKSVMDAVHQAKESIETDRSIEYLERAEELIQQGPA